MVELRNLETFVWIARLGSFRAASEMLNAAQSTLSARIEKLEQQLKVQLFVRSGRRIALTPKGRQLLGHARRMLALHGEMMADVADPEAIGGTVRLGFAETIVHTWVPTFIRTLHSRYPSITLDIIVDTSTHLQDALVSHELDIAFMLRAPDQPAIHSRPLCRYDLAWIATPELRLPRRQLEARDLLGWPIITYSRGTRPYAEIQELLTRPGARRPRLYGSSSLATIIKMTLDGIGISAIPPLVVRNELEQKRLVIIDCAAPLSSMDFVASYSPGIGSLVIRSIAELAVAVADEDTHLRLRSENPIGTDP